MKKLLKGSFFNCFFTMWLIYDIYTIYKPARTMKAQEVAKLISYDPFWDTIKKKGITGYVLVKKYKISNGTLYRMRKGAALSTVTIDMLCQALECKVEEIIEYVPSKQV